MLTNAFVAKQYSRLKGHFDFQGLFVITYLFFAIGLMIMSKGISLNQLYFSSIFMGVGLALLNINVG